jgi:hypothetical protein
MLYHRRRPCANPGEAQHEQTTGAYPTPDDPSKYTEQIPSKTWLTG